MFENYSKTLQNLLETIAQKELGKLHEAASRLATTLKSGGLIHTFGSGHSSLVAADIVGRTGCPVAVNQIIDKTEDMAERIHGYGHSLMKHYAQQYQLLPEDCLIVISNSGRNPLPIEIALAGKERGLSCIAITNVKQASSLASRHESGKNLSQVADIVLDTQLNIGEATLELAHSKRAVAPLSSFAAMFILQSMVLLALAQLDQEGREVAVFQSENASFSNADEHNAALRSRYQGRLRRAGV